MARPALSVLVFAALAVCLCAGTRIPGDPISSPLLRGAPRALLSIVDSGDGDHGDAEEAVSFLTVFAAPEGEGGPVGVVVRELGLEGRNATEREVEFLLELLRESHQDDGHSEEHSEHSDEHNEEHTEEEGDEDHEGEEEEEGDEDHKEEEQREGVRYRLTAHDLLEEFGTGEELTEAGLGDACMTILACQVHDRCELGELSAEEHEDEHDGEGDDLLHLKIIVIFALIVESLLGFAVPYSSRWLPIDVQWWMSMLNCFSAGVILATGVIHIVPEALEEESRVEGLDDYPLALVTVVIGFLIIFFIDLSLGDSHAPREVDASANGKASKALDSTGDSLGSSQESSVKIGEGTTQASEEPPHGKVPQRIAKAHDAIVLLVALCGHGILEGIIVGLEEHKSDFWTLFASVASHKFPAAIALTSRFIKEGCSFYQTLASVAVFSIIAPVGILLGLGLDDVPALAALILQSLAAGTFIFIGAYEVLSQEFGEGRTHGGRRASLMKGGAMIIGVLVIALVALIPHSHSHDEGHAGHGHA